MPELMETFISSATSHSRINSVMEHCLNVPAVSSAKMRAALETLSIPKSQPLGGLISAGDQEPYHQILIIT